MSLKFLKTTVAVMILANVYSLTVKAETESEVDKEVAKVEEIKAKDDVWDQKLKEKFSLTDAQLKTLRDSGLPSPQLAMVAELSKLSQKPLEDILKMRTDKKMGWGEIAKELGIPPRELGHSVRDLRHAIRDERKMARDERREKAEQKREERQEAREHGKGRH